MGPYPREPALDLKRAPEAAPARRLSTRTAPVVADDQRGRRLAPLSRATARRDGTRVPVLSRLHRRPRAEEEAYTRLQSRLHAYPEIGQELLRRSTTPQRAHRQRGDRPHPAGRCRYGGWRAGAARRAGLCHRFRCARVYAADEGDGPQRRDHRGGVEGEDLLIRRHRCAGLSQPLHALWAIRPGEQCPGAVGPRPGNCLHHAAHRRGTRPPRRGFTDGPRDREIPRAPRRRLSGYRVGRRVQKLVHQPATHAGLVAVSAERAPGVLRASPRGRFPVHSCRAGRLIPPLRPRAWRRTVFLRWSKGKPSVCLFKVSYAPQWSRSADVSDWQVSAETSRSSMSGTDGTRLVAVIHPGV